MRDFDTKYLICIDCDKDTNYVVASCTSKGRAREKAKLARKKWPDQEVYITLEKVYRYPDLSDDVMICVCGGEIGGCVGNLRCRCSAVSLCKKVDREGEQFTNLEQNYHDIIGNMYNGVANPEYYEEMEYYDEGDEDYGSTFWVNFSPR